MGVTGLISASVAPVEELVDCVGGPMSVGLLSEGELLKEGKNLLNPLLLPDAPGGAGFGPSELISVKTPYGLVGESGSSSNSSNGEAIFLRAASSLFISFGGGVGARIDASRLGSNVPSMGEISSSIRFSCSPTGFLVFGSSSSMSIALSGASPM
ncbi:hypothetical protein RRF57_009129 [Xylaria bambusicola]|uniref:Uncharacterized protein n=1 Tax=Xylaria bambusicola TaxID=326684 RepID=A0AAN7UJ24_9PEZI